MHLLRKNLIFASFLSFALASFCGALSASAVEQPSITNMIETPWLYPVQTNFMHDDSEEDIGSSPKSMLNRNESQFPNLLYSETGKKDYMGYDGKGIIFTNTDSYINDDQGMIGAGRGDELHFSSIVTMPRYYDDEKSDPMKNFIIATAQSRGLTVDEQSISVTIDGQPFEENEVCRLEFSSDGDASFLNYSSVLGINCDWNNAESYPYSDNAIVEISYSTTVDDDAPSEVFSKVIYAYESESGANNMMEYFTEMFDSAGGQHRVIAMLDSAISIRRLDSNGNSISGVTYTIDGVKANPASGMANVYEYDPDGTVSEFTTDTENPLTILNVPVGYYTFREVSAPKGHESANPVSTRWTADGMSITEFGETRQIMNYVYRKLDMTDHIGIIMLNDKSSLVPGSTMNDLFGESIEDSEVTRPYYSGTPPFSYNDEYISKTGDTYYYNIKAYDRNKGYYNFSKPFTYNEALGKQVVTIGYPEKSYYTVSEDYYLELSGNHATIHDNDKTYELDFDEALEAYIGSSDDGIKNPPMMYQNDKGYVAIIDSGTGATWIWQYSYDSKSQKYVLSGKNNTYALEEINENQARLSNYLVIDYVPEIDSYAVGFSNMAGKAKISPERPSIYLSVIEFGESKDESYPEDAPENIPSNPQTSDAILKTLAIVVVCVLSAAIAKNRLLKR